ncbi:cutinase transcription factor 1 beta [Fusarium tjaetaba]|uniref:Cutinase transcription factor 1 beta n=1 Tax=Fusarium tjaetaba TaxID=1567544 RepID=A0A8H5S2T8_9HYPO|nr:cutinase transcription factor 1 beta [Fusarium tjaetaba]KAF5643544.1 cutinase transcription factor 1 beta [Fusarium tjaetaba]
MPVRTAIACRRCNARKIKCLAPNGVPCLNCDSAGADCQLIESRRGKYPRQRRLRASKSSPVHKDPEADETLQSSSSSSNPPAIPQSPQHAVLASPSISHRDIEFNATDAHEIVVADSGDGNTNAANINSTATTQDTPESPGFLHARIAENSANNSTSTITDTNRTAFLGEAFSLSYVVHNVIGPLFSSSSTHPHRLHFPLTCHSDGDPGPRSRVDTVTCQISHLRSQRLLYFPCRETLHLLLDCYFEAFHPAFPILDEASFRRATDAGETSLIVLSALLMVAVSICTTDVLQQNGSVSRYGARSIYYHQAKALYDADQEPSKVDIIVGTFLMSFWWGGPNDPKDSWHWLGITSNLATSLGMHRSTQHSSVDSKTASRWKRIWWSIYIRENLVSGSIGKPRHISDSDWDVEAPTEKDLENVVTSERPERAAYFIHMAHLSKIFGGILSSRYAASKPVDSSKGPEDLEHDLQRFRSELPGTMAYRGLGPGQHGLWAAMLAMATCYATILLCRPQNEDQNDENCRWGNRQKAFDAANEITRIIEDILADSAGRLCQIHTIPALFNALAMHLLSLCESRELENFQVRKGLGEARSDICMLGLEVLQESWPVGRWVYRLFAMIRSRMRDYAQPEPSGMVNHPAPAYPPLQQEADRAGEDSRDDIQEDIQGWQGHDNAEQGVVASWLPTPLYSAETFSPHQFLDLTAQSLLLEDYIPDIFTFN